MKKTDSASGTNGSIFSVPIGLLLLPCLNCGGSGIQSPTPLPPTKVVIVVEENKNASEIYGSLSAPYLNTLASAGAKMTNSFGITHPSQPNYLALFSGSTQGVTDDSCPHTFNTPNLGASLLQSGSTFAGYSESLPSIGFTGCTSGAYAAKHCPWSMFTNVPASSNLPFSAFPQNNFTALPTVSIVIPNLDNDMHDGTIQTGDTWLSANISAYVRWAQTNNSLLIITFDEDDNTSANIIPTVLVGPMITPGEYSEKIDHYNILRTLCDFYHLEPMGGAANAASVKSVWRYPVYP